MKTINLPASEKVNILAISLKCQCKKCGWIWSTSLGFDGKPSIDFDVCNRCKSLEKMEVSPYEYK